MTEREEREQQQAELLWRYIEELKQSENPDQVQFVAVTSGEPTEVVGLMEMAAEAYTAARAAAAPHCRREAVRRRLQAAIAEAAPRPAASRVAAAPVPRERPPVSALRLPAWLTAPLAGRSAGWAVAAAALLALVWFAAPRSPQVASPPPSTDVVQLNHDETIKLMPALAKGTLEVKQSKAVWEHLLDCQHCYEIYQEKWQEVHPAQSLSGVVLPPVAHLHTD
jgi:hypothetical protein